MNRKEYTIFDSYDTCSEENMKEAIEQDIVDSYIENDCTEAFDKVMDSCSSSDLYDYAHKIIDRL